MTKPNWDMAPPWANYVAQNEDGRWYWYQIKPAPVHEARAWGTIGRRETVWPTTVTNWLETVAPRPTLVDPNDTK
jgi:hypothetical protein